MLLLSVIFFAIFLGMQHYAVKEKLLKLSLEGVDHLVFILGCLLALFYSNERFIILQDIFYGFTWSLGLEYKSLLFFMTYIVLVVKNERDRPEQQARFGIKELVVVATLFVGLALSSIIVWSILLLVFFSLLKLTTRDKLIVQALPFFLILIEAYSASSLGFLTYSGVDKYEVAYQSMVLSCLLSSLFVSGVMLLLAKRSIGNLTSSLCLGGYIVLYSKVSPLLNTGEFFSYYHLALTGFWFVYTLRHGAVIETFYSQSKQVIFLIVFLIMIGVTGPFVTDSLFWSAAILLSNTLLMQHYSEKQELSILVAAKRVLSVILFSMVSLEGIGSLIYFSKDTTTGVNVLLILGFSLVCWQMLLRLNYSQRYDLKSELFSDFSNGPFGVNLGLTIILMLVLIYQITSTHFTSIFWLYALAIPSGLILLANVLKKLSKTEKYLSFLYSVHPDHLVSQLSVGLSEGQRVLLCLGKVILGVIGAFLQTVNNLINYLCYVSDAILEKSLKYKVHAIFIIWAVLISFVTSWSL